ncbi:hypothetical protein SUGI_0928720 [Cryptomeria japonica]|nr:hypothetical protein SUGI_0928720 [Cryptomeria japonica]
MVLYDALAEYRKSIGIVNTMDLPNKLLPRIESHMGMKRLCFGPYSYQQLQEIISSHLNGIEAFEKQVVLSLFYGSVFPNELLDKHVLQVAVVFGDAH